MRDPRSVLVALALLTPPIACGSSGGADGAGNGAGSDAGSGAGSPGQPDAGGGPTTAPPDAGGGDDGAPPTPGDASTGAPSTVTSLAFPQAIAGAMWASPATYANIPVHVAIGGAADSVGVSIDNGPPIAATDAHDGTWAATVPIAALSAGSHDVVASAIGGAGSAPVTAHATLGIGSSGMQMTTVGTVGNAGTPRLLSIGGSTYVAWTDRSGAHADAYLRAIDGAGGWKGTKVSLVGSAHDVFTARTAVGGDGAIGVLYQEGTPSNPYVNFIEVVDATGKKLVAPIALEPTGMYGSYGGDIAFDGKAFVATWRSNSGAGMSQLMWIRVAADGTKVGPVVVTPLAAGQAEGGFDPITPIHIASAGGQSVLSYVQYHQDAIAASQVPKARVTVLNADGSVAKTSYCGGADDARWYTENRSFDVATAPGAFWGSKDLNDPATNPRTVFFATALNAQGVPGSPSTIVNQVGDRAEPFVIAHPTMNAVAAWTDVRSEDANPSAGHIQLMAAALDAKMTPGAELLFDHARFVESTSELSALLAGTNVVLVWLDERHGGSIMTPRPEVYLETVWY